jgi:hypothetical protein
VKFTSADPEAARWGGNDNPIKAGLILGKTYNVEAFEVYSWHTKIFLSEFPGKKFNSVHFTF